MRIAAVMFAGALALTTYALHANTLAELPEGWSLQGEAPELFSARVDHDDTPSGQGSMVLKREETSHVLGTGQLVKKLPVALYAGKLVRLSVHIKAEGAAKMQDGLAIVSTDSSWVSGEDHPQGWYWARKIMGVSAGMKELGVGVSLKGPGEVKVDVIEVEVIGEVPADQKGITLKNADGKD